MNKITSYTSDEEKINFYLEEYAESTNGFIDMSRSDNIRDDIILSKEEYVRLCRRDLMLQALEYVGVEDWSGYSIALTEYENLEPWNFP